jgi:hypothetical protein
MSRSVGWKGSRSILLLLCLALTFDGRETEITTEQSLKADSEGVNRTSHLHRVVLAIAAAGRTAWSSGLHERSLNEPTPFLVLTRGARLRRKSAAASSTGRTLGPVIITLPAQESLV